MHARVTPHDQVACIASHQVCCLLLVVPFTLPEIGASSEGAGPFSWRPQMLLRLSSCMTLTGVVVLCTAAGTMVSCMSPSSPLASAKTLRRRCSVTRRGVAVPHAGQRHHHSTAWPPLWRPPVTLTRCQQHSPLLLRGSSSHGAGASSKRMASTGNTPVRSCTALQHHHKGCCAAQCIRDRLLVTSTEKKHR